MEKIQVTGCKIQGELTHCRGVSVRAFFAFDTQSGEIKLAIPLEREIQSKLPLDKLVGKKASYYLEFIEERENPLEM